MAAGRYTQLRRRAAFVLTPADRLPHPDHSRHKSAKWPVETSGSQQPSHARSASAGITRPTRASETTRSGFSCANTAAGAGATPRIGKRASARPEHDVARNRKRAKERRARRPRLDPSIRPSLATARADRDSLRDAPSPLEHADARRGARRRPAGARPARLAAEPATPEGDDPDSGSGDRHDERYRLKRRRTIVRRRRPRSDRADGTPLLRRAGGRLPARLVDVSAGKLARASASTVARSSAGDAGHWGCDRVCDRGRRVPRSCRHAGWQACQPRHQVIAP